MTMKVTSGEKKDNDGNPYKNVDVRDLKDGESCVVIFKDNMYVGSGKWGEYGAVTVALPNGDEGRLFIQGYWKSDAYGISLLDRFKEFGEGQSVKITRTNVSKTDHRPFMMYSVELVEGGKTQKGKSLGAKGKNTADIDDKAVLKMLREYDFPPDQDAANLKHIKETVKPLTVANVKEFIEGQ